MKISELKELLEKHDDETEIKVCVSDDSDTTRRNFKMTKNKTLIDFINSIGMIPIENDYGEVRDCFPNGYYPSIIDKDDGFSIACMDDYGYINYDLPEKNEVYFCRTELQAMALIERISKIGEWNDYTKPLTRRVLKPDGSIVEEAS